jgi:hypothetical protein
MTFVRARLLLQCDRLKVARSESLNVEGKEKGMRV